MLFPTESLITVEVCVDEFVQQNPSNVICFWVKTFCFKLLPAVALLINPFIFNPAVKLQWNFCLWPSFRGHWLNVKNQLWRNWGHSSYRATGNFTHVWVCFFYDCALHRCLTFFSFCCLVEFMSYLCIIYVFVSCLESMCLWCCCKQGYNFICTSPYLCLNSTWRLLLCIL